MPSKHQAAGKQLDRPTFPRLRDEFGEDPARFLCTDLSPWPMIRGLREPERAAAWLAVARNVDADSRVVETLESTVEKLREGSE